ncbi:MAG: phosphoribosylglycinamide formyltransferase [Pleurocapsa sp.]
MTESSMQNNLQDSSDVLISPNLASIPSPSLPLQLGIMASGNGTNFAAVSKAIADGKLNAEIKVLIYNNPQAEVKDRAKQHNIPAILIDHRNYQQRENFDHEIVAVLKAYGADWVVMAGWMRIITQVLLDGYPNGVINIHPSLLPSFKGMKAVEQALAAKVKITGCTAHLVNLEVDSGEIIMQAAVPVLLDDNLDTLHARIQKQEHVILPKAIALAASVADNERISRIG